jgi:Xaa-Pro aminopeptidase
MNRVGLLRQLLKECDLDLLLIYSTSHDGRFFRWITGNPCRSSCNYLLVERESLGWLELGYHLTDLPSVLGAAIHSVEEIDGIPSALAELVRGRARVGLIGEIPFWPLTEVAVELRALKAEGDVLLWLKSPGEIGEMAELGKRLVQDIDRVAQSIDVGMTERDLANALRIALHMHGGREAFPLSIVSGERLLSTTLGAPSDRILSPADAICIDCGIESSAIFSDCTRMYFLQDSHISTSYKRLCEAHRGVIAQIVEGMTFGAIAELFEAELARRGFRDHNLRLAELGHGIGFALHETPFLMNRQSEDVRVASGMVFTLEPEITVSGYQIRVEDMVAITAGGALVLTQ